MYLLNMGRSEKHQLDAFTRCHGLEWRRGGREEEEREKGGRKEGERRERGGRAQGEREKRRGREEGTRRKRRRGETKEKRRRRGGEERARKRGAREEGRRKEGAREVEEGKEDGGKRRKRKVTCVVFVGGGRFYLLRWRFMTALLLFSRLGIGRVAMLSHYSAPLLSRLRYFPTYTPLGTGCKSHR